MQKFTPSRLDLPVAIRVKLTLPQRAAITHGLRKIIDALNMKAIAETSVADIPKFKRTKKAREGLRSIEKHLTAILKHDDLLSGVVPFFAHRPGDREIAEAFPRDARRVLSMVQRANKDKAKLFYTKAKIPARVAADIHELMTANRLKPTLTYDGLWERLISLAYHEADISLSDDAIKNAMRLVNDMKKNAMRRSVKIHKKCNKKYTK